MRQSNLQLQNEAADKVNYRGTQNYRGKSFIKYQGKDFNLYPPCVRPWLARPAILLLCHDKWYKYHNFEKT